MVQFVIFKKNGVIFISTKKKMEKKIDTPHFRVETEGGTDRQNARVKVIWDNKSEVPGIPRIRVLWDNENPGKIKIEIDGEEKTLSKIREC